MTANIHHSSASTEWYTPSWLVEYCRTVLGGIDVDPCSCEEAQKIIGARKWFGEDEDGLSKSWRGNVFMNPPGGFAPSDVAEKWGSKSSAQCWYSKLLYEIDNENARDAIVVCFNLDTLRALQPSQPICILAKRVKFDKLVDGKRIPGNSPAHGTGLILLSDSIKTRKIWAQEMSNIGTCYGATL